ncbi:unnamed protein product [Parnassius mnemosyne]|uniref:Uncharacterized protein n=1 Tax=Parnassius mnemosyne TaxID=213953 RepID=A0AAV1KBL6_9NEOP
MACADGSGSFTSIDVGDYGRNNDSGVFKNSRLGQALNNNILNIPKLSYTYSSLKNSDDHFLIILQLTKDFRCVSTDIMRPYNGRSLNNNRRIFNYRLSRGRKSASSL